MTAHTESQRQQIKAAVRARDGAHHMTAQENAFLEAIAITPGDTVSRLAYADWLDEHASPDEAYAWRFSVHRSYFPRRTPKGLWWRWSCKGRKSSGKHFLPREIFANLDKAKGFERGNYRTMRAAFAALALALLRLRRLTALDPERLE